MNRVFILGAGATAGYKTDCNIAPPVAASFLAAAVRLCKNKTLPAERRLEKNKFALVWGFVEKHYPAQFNNLAKRANAQLPHSIDIEELLTLVDLAGNRPLREQMVRLIVLTLYGILWGGHCKHHERLLSSLDPDDAILTFNWDLILDNLAFSHGTPPDYGTTLLNVRGGIEGNQRGPLVLKLHGSMNWTTCDSCSYHEARGLEGKIVAHAFMGTAIQCPRCHEPMDALMIYPTLFKTYDRPLWKQIWERARCVLRSAREIRVVGYSLPPTDFAAKWLFRQTSVERNRPLESLTIVDTSHNPTALLDRFADVFHHPSLHVNGGIAKFDHEGTLLQATKASRHRVAKTSATKMPKKK